MGSKNEITQRNSKIFVARTNKVKGARMHAGLDNKPMSLKRIQEALCADPDFEILLKRIEKKPRKETLL